MKIHFLISIVVLMSSFSSWASRDRANDSKELMRASDKIPYVLMISIDGYRYDYTERFHPPHLSRLAQEGVRAKSLQSVFPSKTFPNHYSLVTGLYAGGHGIVENRFYDTAFGATYALGDPITNESRWYGGDPLWNVVQAYGIKSACYFWVGSDVEINGQRPTYYKPYDGSVENRERIKQILNWLSLPEKDRPHFLTLYFSAVDSQGHQHGPKDPVKEPPHPLKESVLEIDKVLGELFDGLQKTGLDINVIVVSDHGMKDIDEYKYLGDKGIDYSDFKVVGSGPMIQFYKLNDKADVDRLKNQLVFSSQGKYKVYKKSEIPEKYHYTHPTRVGDLILVSEWGVYTYADKTRAQHQQEIAQAEAEGKHPSKATHGWDPSRPEMQGIFYARGPQFKQNQVIDAFENIHIYPAVLSILGVKPLYPIDGRLEVLSPIIRR